jgi:hypothetical protein
MHTTPTSSSYSKEDAPRVRATPKVSSSSHPGYLDMGFDPSIKDGIYKEIGSTKIITAKARSSSQREIRNSKYTKQCFNPNKLSNGISERFVFSFDAGAINNSLFLSTP